VAANIPRDFPASGGVTHQRHVLEFQRLDDSSEIVGIAIHIIPLRSLARSAVTTAVMRDDAETVLREEKHLAIPGV